MSLAQLNKCVLTLLNKLKKKTWTAYDTEESDRYINQLKSWLEETELELIGRTFTDDN